MKQRQKKQKKPAPTPIATDEPSELKNAPHSFIIYRGLHCMDMVRLSRDFRRMMEPFTAAQLKERKANRVKDYVAMSGFFHVSHMCLFTRTEVALSMKIIRLPRGPTLTFKVHQYTLAKDVISSMKRQMVDLKAFQSPPLVILNSFSGEGKHLKLMATTFQNMFPPINLTTVKLSSIKRCVLLSYNPTTKLVELRHYAITCAPVGINKGVKKIVNQKIPDLSKCEDIAEFLAKAEVMSDSEFDDPDHHVNLPQNLGKGNLEDNKSSIRLYELGPRITFQLIKIEEDLMNGEVLYHDFIVKTEQEQAEIRKKRDVKKKLKQARKVQQDANLKRKEQQKEENKKKALKGRQATEHDKQLLRDAEEAIPDVAEDDKEYFRDEVGAEPEDELFQGQQSRKRPFVPKGFKQGIAKKPRLDKDQGKGKEKGERGRREGRGDKRGDGGGFRGKHNDHKTGKKFGGKAGGPKKVANRFSGGKGKKNKRR